jgi:sterol desaturase/sphingolipid hydroxylase (fatty acid hydroxylase superfamily)
MELKYIQILVLAGVFALQFLIEHRFPQRREMNRGKNERFNIAIGLLNAALTFIPAGLLVSGLELLEKNRWGLLQQFQLSLGWQLLVAILVMDFWMYVWHGLNHRVPLLWRLHRFHHRDDRMNSTTALRFHVLELFLSYPGKALVCFVFGITYAPLLIYEIFFFTAVIIHHSNMFITERADRIYRVLFASPRMHRVHHAPTWEQTDSNFGALFSFWDRLFGSWKKGEGEVERFGAPDDEPGREGSRKGKRNGKRKV